MSSRAPQPPSAWKKSLSVVAGRVSSSTMCSAIAFSVSVSLSTSASSADPAGRSALELSGSAMGHRGTQLVARIEDHPFAVDDADAARHDQLDARLDAGDLAPPEPDHGHRSGAVVQLALEGRHAAARAERHRTQGSRDGHQL